MAIPTNYSNYGMYAGNGYPIQQQGYYSQAQAPANSQYNYQPQPAVLKGRPVSSIEEVKAAQIDFDGSLFTFLDIANKKIYTKQINVDGTATINTYALEQGTNNIAETSYVTKEEFAEFTEKLKEILAAQQQPAKTQAKEMPSLNF